MCSSWMVVTQVWGFRDPAFPNDAVLQLIKERVRQSPHRCDLIAGNNHNQSCLRIRFS